MIKTNIKISMSVCDSILFREGKFREEEVISESKRRLNSNNITIFDDERFKKYVKDKLSRMCDNALIARTGCYYFSL